MQTESTDSALPCDPIIHSYQLSIAPPDFEDSRSDYKRVVDALKATGHSCQWEILPQSVVQLSRIARATGWRFTAYGRSDEHAGELIGFSDRDRPAIGLAVDVGCTKIAAYLVDLLLGKQLAAGGIPNPQLSYGEDLITRLVFAAKEDANADLMASLVGNAINELAAELCSKAGIQTCEIADACIVGNTAMIHLLLRLPVQQLLYAPFIAAIDRGMEVRASDLRLECAPGAQVYIPPSIGGFVGADHVAMILSHGIDSTSEVTIGIDVGTNTEIVVCNPRTNALVSTSVPSGPAFEGGHVGDGMRAASGAIEKIFFVGGKLQFQTVGDEKALGICGSGIVDLLAELHRLQYIDVRGHLVQKDSLVRHGKTGLEFLVVAAGDSGCEHDIVVTQHDITEIQLAKAAVSARIATLLDITETDVPDVQEMVVAGAFGSYLDLRNAIAIGLLPSLPNAHYSQIGNAAGAGAKLALVSRKERDRAAQIANRVTRIELKHYESFNRLLARATRFPTHPPQLFRL